MGYPPGFATPRIVCDVPYVGKRWVHQVAEYDRERGISYWTTNYRTGIERTDEPAPDRRYTYYDRSRRCRRAGSSGGPSGSTGRAGGLQPPSCRPRTHARRRRPIC
jgi:lysine 2,3-aminomutase